LWPLIPMHPCKGVLSLICPSILCQTLSPCLLIGPMCDIYIYVYIYTVVPRLSRLISSRLYRDKLISMK
jgi:antibiotic biosynthesis monooxygenase (ABM) superfamily enzyme